MLVILAWGDGEGDSGRGGPSEPSLASGLKERVTKKKKKKADSFWGSAFRIYPWPHLNTHVHIHKPAQETRQEVFLGCSCPVQSSPALQLPVFHISICFHLTLLNSKHIHTHIHLPLQTVTIHTSTWRQTSSVISNLTWPACPSNLLFAHSYVIAWASNHPRFLSVHHSSILSLLISKVSWPLITFFYLPD